MDLKKYSVPTNKSVAAVEAEANENPLWHKLLPEQIRLGLSSHLCNYLHCVSAPLPSDANKTSKAEFLNLCTVTFGVRSFLSVGCHMHVAGCWTACLASTRDAHGTVPQGCDDGRRQFQIFPQRQNHPRWRTMALNIFSGSGGKLLMQKKKKDL